MKRVLEIKESLQGTTLDARISNKEGKELVQEIFKTIEDSQRFILAPLPSRLLVTQKQFASLNNYTEEMYATTDRLFKTPFNVMEVHIDRDIDTVAEIEQTIVDVENLTKLEELTDE